MRSHRKILVLIAASALLAGCGGDLGDGTEPAPSTSIHGPATDAPTEAPTTEAPEPTPKATKALTKKKKKKKVTAKPTRTVTRPVYYANCAAARAAGAAPLHRGDSGYRSALDRDSDGIACE